MVLQQVEGGRAKRGVFDVARAIDEISMSALDPRRGGCDPIRGRIAGTRQRLIRRECRAGDAQNADDNDEGGAKDAGT
ncbi:MAG: hypothetical protein M3N26_12305 [Pseudomonadota bacterium]|nr:hypothetical protein [Pseudomonadota bacterium]